jgi:hypothetical protein
MKGPILLFIVAGCLTGLGALLPLSQHPTTNPRLLIPLPWKPRPHPRGYVCYRAAKPPVIDGKLDDPAWQAVPWSEPFVDIEGDAKPKPPLRTRMKMLWDDTCLFIGAELEEPHVWATIKQHDAVIFQDNDFEVFIDPDGDSHAYGELEINALNTTWDLLLTMPYKDNGLAINGWEIAGLKTAVHVNGTLNDPSNKDKAWSVEIAIPWAALTELTHNNKLPRDGDHWRINFSRVEWQHEIVDGKYQKVPKRPENNWVWSPQGVIDMHRPETWGYVQFSTAEPGKAEFVPDAAWPAKEVLHRVYYAQRDYREKHKRWAKDLTELGLADFKQESLAGPPEMDVAGELFEGQDEAGRETVAYSVRCEGLVGMINRLRPPTRTQTSHKPASGVA